MVEHGTENAGVDSSSLSPALLFVFVCGNPGKGRNCRHFVDIESLVESTMSLSTTVALLTPAGIAAVGNDIFGLWLGASVSIGTSQAQNQWNALASIPGG